MSIPWSTINSIIKKWKEYGTTTNLPREGRPPKHTDQARRALIRVATKRPKISLKELQRSTAEIGVPVHRTTLSLTLPPAGLFGRVARKMPLLKEKNKQTRLEDSLNIWKKVLEVMRDFWPSRRMLCLAQTQHFSSHREYYPHSETWWWQHHAVGMVLFG